MDPRAAVEDLFDASKQALQAYRAIFGRSCWNDRDRQAFRRLEESLLRSAEAFDAAFREPPRESLARKLARRPAAAPPRRPAIGRPAA